MSRDLEQLLRDTAVRPSEPVDAATLVSRGRRRRRLRHTAATVGSLAAIALVATLAIGPLTAPQPPSVVDQPPTDREAASQSAADAERDGVLPEIAALPFDVRVNQRPDSGGDTTRLVTDEGVWIVSHTAPGERPGGPLVGDPDGVFGRDFVHLDTYAEILLLDGTETEVLRAFPMAPHPAPTALTVDDDAVYCHRAGDGGAPDSMLCRVDRTSYDWLVRIFPQPERSAYDGPDTYVPEHWVIDEPVDGTLAGDLVATDGSLRLESDDRVHTFDPATLQLLTSTDDAGPTTDDEQLIADFLRFAADPGPDTAAAVPFADEVSLGLGPDLHVTRSASALADPDAWVIDVEVFRAYAGPFSALDLAADAEDTVVSVGEHDHCVAPPEPPPSEVADLRRVSVQPDPDTIDSCLRWWTVDLFVSDEGRVVAVTLDLYAP